MYVGEEAIHPLRGKMIPEEYRVWMMHDDDGGRRRSVKRQLGQH